jgi:hypothetical protein
MKPPPSPTSEPKTLIAKARTKSQRLSAAALYVKDLHAFAALQSATPSGVPAPNGRLTLAPQCQRRL